MNDLYSNDYKAKIAAQRLKEMEDLLIGDTTQAKPEDPAVIQQKQTAFLEADGSVTKNIEQPSTGLTDQDRKNFIDGSNLSVEDRNQAVKDGLDNSIEALKPFTQEGGPGIATPDNFKTEDTTTADTPTDKSEDKDGDSLLKSFGKFIWEAPEQIKGGMKDAGNEIWQSLRDIGEAVGLPDPYTLQFRNEKGDIDFDILSKEEVEAKGGVGPMYTPTKKAETTGGEVVRSLTQFVAPFFVGTGALKAAGMTGTGFAAMSGRGALSGGATGFAAMDPDGPNVSALLQQYPALRNPVSAWLAGDEDDSALESRTKNALEEMGLGIAVDSFAKVLGTIFKSMRGVKAAKAAELPKTPDQVLTDEVTKLKVRDDAIESIIPEDVVVKTINKAGQVEEVIPGIDLGPEEILTKTNEGKTYLNHNRINTSDDIHNTLQKMVDEVDVSKVTTNAETIERSSKEFTELTDLLDREPQRPFTAAEAVASRELMTSSADRVTTLAKELSAAKAAGTQTPEMMFQFRKAVETHRAIQEVVIKGRKATAQSLQSWNIPVSSRRSKQIADVMMDKGYGTDELVDMITQIDEVGGNVSKVIGKTGIGTKIFDALYQTFINGLLSGPKTHARNMISNMASNILSVPEGYIKAGFEGMAGRGGPALAAANGRTIGFFNGMLDMWQTMGGKGNPALQQGAKYGLDRPNALSVKALTGKEPATWLGKGLDYLSGATTWPGWMLQKEDNLFKGWAYRMKMQELAHVKAFEQNLSGKEMKSFVKNFLDNAPQEQIDEAIEFAKYQTFTDAPGKVTRHIQGIMSEWPVLKIVAPFINTPSRIFSYQFERTPLALIQGKVRTALAKGGPEASEVKARIALGTTIMATTAALALDGFITGSGSNNKNKRKAQEATGFMPYSFKFGDTYVSFEGLAPWGPILGYGADMAQIMNGIGEEEAGDLVAGGAVGLLNSLEQQAMISGITDFFSACASRDEEKIMKYFSEKAGQLIPNPVSSLGREFNHYFDPVKKDYDYGHEDTIGRYWKASVEKFKDGVPGWGSDAPPLRDIWGEELVYSGDISPELEAVIPMKMKTVKDDPINNMIVDNNMEIGLPSRTIMGIRSTNEEYSEYCKLSGQKAKKTLDKLYARGVFDRLTGGPEGTKADVVKRVLRTAREEAAKQIYRNTPDFKRRYTQSIKDEIAAKKGTVKQ